MKSFQTVDRKYLQVVWPVVAPMIDEAMKPTGGEYNTDQLKVMIIHGTHHLGVWMDGNEITGVMVTEFIDMPNERIAFVNAASGVLDGDLDTWEGFCTWAKLQGATAVRGAATDSAARLWAQHYGFQKRYTIVEKKL